MPPEGAAQASPVLFIAGFAGSVLKTPLAPGMEMIGKPFTPTALASRVEDMLNPLDQ